VTLSIITQQTVMPVDKMSKDMICVDKMSVDKMFVDKMSAFVMTFRICL
jgi:hypothetical protein